MTRKTEKLLSLLNGQPVIPVLKIANVAEGQTMARKCIGGPLSRSPRKVYKLSAA